MKKFFAFMMAAVAAVAFVSSCTKDDDVDAGLKTDKIEGSWECTDIWIKQDMSLNDKTFSAEGDLKTVYGALADQLKEIPLVGEFLASEFTLSDADAAKMEAEMGVGTLRLEFGKSDLKTYEKDEDGKWTLTSTADYTYSKGNLVVTEKDEEGRDVNVTTKIVTLTKKKLVMEYTIDEEEDEDGISFKVHSVIRLIFDKI